MTRRASTTNASSPLVIAELMKKVRKLATTVQSQAWGSLGAAFGFATAKVLIQRGVQFFSLVELTSIGYVAAISLYTIFGRSVFITNRCLLMASMLYAGQKIDAKEYDTMRKKCLKKAGLI
jgi:hypothetical protein